MKSRIRIKSLVFIAATGLLASGCIGPLFSRNTTIYQDVGRACVEFESDAAARLFYETMSKHPRAELRTESRTQVDIPILYEHTRTVVPGRNTEFNEAVAQCDLNRDGIVTELEAKVFANQR